MSDVKIFYLSLSNKDLHLLKMTYLSVTCSQHHRSLQNSKIIYTCTVKMSKPTILGTNFCFVTDRCLDYTG